MHPIMSPFPHTSHNRYDDSSNSADDIEDSSGQEGSMPPLEKAESNADALQQTLQKLYPTIDPKDIEDIFPSRLENDGSNSRVKISLNGLHLTFRHYGPPDQRHPYMGAYVRARIQIPRKCGVYYFEVKCLRSDANNISIGFARARRDHDRVLERVFHGYRGSDGHFVSNSNVSEYGPPFGNGDVIGCYIDFIGRNISFCRNGIKLGNVPFRMEPFEHLYPCVSLMNDGDSIEANFGQKPFVYEFGKELVRVRETVLENIRKIHLPEEKVDGIRRMIASYLQCEGYVKTVEAFSRATNSECEEDMSSVKKRREIIEAILSRNSETAYLKTVEYFPEVFDANQEPLLYLKAQQFVELAWRNSELLYLRKKESQMLRESVANGSSASQPRHSVASSSHALSPEAAEPTSGRSSLASPIPGQKRPHSRSSQPSVASRRTALHHSTSGNGHIPPLDLDDGTDDDCCKNGNGVAATSYEADDSEQSEANGAVSNGTCDLTADEEPVEYTPEDMKRIEKLISLGQEITEIATTKGSDLDDELIVFADKALDLMCKPRKEFRGHFFLSQRHLRRVARQVNAYLLDPSFGQSGSALDAMIGSLEVKKEELVHKDCPSMSFIDVSEILYGFPGPLPDSDDEEFYSSCTESDSDYDDSDFSDEAETDTSEDSETESQQTKEDTPMEDPNVPCSSHSLQS